MNVRTKKLDSTRPIGKRRAAPAAHAVIRASGRVPCEEATRARMAYHAARQQADQDAKNGAYKPDEQFAKTLAIAGEKVAKKAVDKYDGQLIALGMDTMPHRKGQTLYKEDLVWTERDWSERDPF